ncbi:MAG: hypothetical protein KIT09_04130 [Bryobacteraceae bacterium]|nr:hypothetical protein [Bryobacteraceae bacterium]
MVVGSRVLLAAGAACVLGLFSGRAAAEKVIKVHVCNLADVPAPILAKAIKEARRVFATAEITLTFRDRGPSQKFIFDPHKAPTDLFVRILPESLSARFSKDRTVLGFAQPVGEREFPYVVSIFYARVWARAKEAGLNPAIILGHVIAHELGHLLLGAEAHSLRGMMRCRWFADELTAAVQGRLLFRPEEAERMQAQVAERVTAARAKPTRTLLPAATTNRPAGAPPVSLFHGER